MVGRRAHFLVPPEADLRLAGEERWVCFGVIGVFAGGVGAAGGFAGGFEVSGFDGGAFGVSGGGGLVHVGGGEVGVVGDGPLEGEVLEVGVVVDEVLALVDDAFDGGRGLVVGGGVHDGGELVEGDVVDLADLHGCGVRVEEVVEQVRCEGVVAGRRGMGGRGGRRGRDAGVIGWCVVGCVFFDGEHAHGLALSLC